MVTWDTYSLIEKIKPESAAPEEKEFVKLLGLGDYEIYSEKLTMICEEAAEIFMRTGVTSMLHSGDSIVGLYTAKGDLVTASCGTYLHAVTAQIPIKYILEHFRDSDTVGIAEGDIFYCNEAAVGGIHNPDQLAYIPIFHQGELIAWSCAGVHQSETDACEPGGMPVSARSRHDEGMKLTPIKIGTNYKLREDILLMLANMISRAPRMQVIDTRARATACDKVRQRVQQLAADKGTGFVVGLFRKMIVTAAEGARKRIRSWNDGTYRAASFMDTIGHSEALLRVCLTVHKEGDHLYFDFTGTSPEHDGSFQSYLHGVAAHAAVYLYTFAFNDLPVSSGVYEPLDFHAPRGCFYNPGMDAAVSVGPPACGPVFNLIHQCMSKLMFDSGQQILATAPGGNAGSGYVFAGINQWGVPVAELAAFPLNTEGLGGRRDQDGVNTYGFPWCNIGRAPDAEDAENEYPFWHLFQKHMRDSCGHGKYRGGAGSASAFVVHHMPMLFWMSMGRSSKIPASMALFGGYPSGSTPGIQIRRNNLSAMMQLGSKNVPTSIEALVGEQSIDGEYTLENNLRITRMLEQGDIFVGTSFGGGGYGDALERDPWLVLEDLRDELISDWVARNVYKVAYNPETKVLDPEETARLRQAELEDRKNRGKSFTEFEQEWNFLKPKDEIMQYYGSWPDAKPIRPIFRI